VGEGVCQITIVKLQLKIEMQVLQLSSELH
jgi:hypothetical protein